MKLTAILCRQNYHRMIKRLWKKHSRIAVAPLEIPPELQELGIKIHDARDVAKQEKSYDVSEKTDAVDLVVAEDYSPSAGKFYLFHNKVRVTEKEAQVLCLTKTVSYPGLPSVLNSLVGIEQIPNQDQLIQNYLLQAFVRDSQLVKLPKKIDITKPSYIFPREYGIRYKRKSASLMTKLSFLSEMGCSKYPESHTRSKTLDPFSEVVVEKGGDTIVFQILGDILFTSQKPLKPFASPSEVAATSDVLLPSIYPVKPTLDLDQCETSPARCVDDIHLFDLAKPANCHVHTLHIIHKSFGFWFPVQKLSRAIASCFTFAAQEARRVYGNDVKELPNPISIQCVYSDLQSIGFLAYQLNTLDFSTEDGVKNQVWIEESQKLCNDIDVNATAIQDYNDTIFPKMLAMYLNGAHPASL